MEVKRSGQIWEIFKTMVNEMWGAKENETLEQSLSFFTSGIGWLISRGLMVFIVIVNSVLLCIAISKCLLLL